MNQPLPAIPDYHCDLKQIACSVPECLRGRHQWVCWRWKRAKTKWSKMPIDAHTGGDADSTAARTWGSFEAAARGFQRLRGIAGVGFVFSPDDPYCGVDLDKCFDPATGIIMPWAIPIIRRLDSYCEISPSGNGVKLFIRASKPGDKCKTAYEDGDVEIYDHARFFTTTGRRIIRCFDNGRIQTG